MEVAACLSQAMASNVVHSAEIGQSIDLHRREIRQARELHEHALNIATDTHRHALQLSRRLHAVQVRLTVDLARREAIRDLFRHRSVATQTVVVADALMISCVFQMVSKFSVADGGWVITLYATTLAVAILLLVLSTITSLQLTARMVNYNMHKHLMRYRCGKIHPTFNSYFECHCALLETTSRLLFYGGASFTVASAVVNAYLLFALSLDLLGAAIAFAVLSGFGVAAMWVGDWLLPSRTHDGADDFVGINEQMAQPLSTSSPTSPQAPFPSTAGDSRIGVA